MLLYRQSAGWQDYLAYHKQSITVQDYGNAFYNYLDHEELYEQNGVSLTEAYMFAGLQYADPEVFTYEKVSVLAELQEELTRAQSRIGESFFEGLKEAFKTSFQWHIFFVLGIAIAMIYILCKDHSKDHVLRIVIPILLLALLTVGEICYLVYIGRYLWRALIIPVMSFDLMTVLWIVMDISTPQTVSSESLEEGGEKKKNKDLALVLVGGIATIVLLEMIFVHIRDNYKVMGEAEYASVFDQLSVDEDHYYICDAHALWDYGCGVQDWRKLCAPTYRDYFSSVCITGGWVEETPFGKISADNKGISNPLLSLTERGDTFFVTDGSYGEGLVYMMSEYYREHYGIEVTPVLILQGDVVQIWQFR